ncbi:MAG: biotin transporter BioY [Lachnospiraceae bacterium]|nr:biotin transporter BioY [Lachnospiraceae bacterium]
MENEVRSKNKLSVYQMAVTALMAALMCVLCPLSIPIGPIPVSLSIFIILFSVYILGTRLGVLSYVIYLLLGVAGLPVFSGGEGGIGKLIGPTGGYLIGFIFLALIAGIFIEKGRSKIWLSVVGMLIGLFVDYLLGTAWFVISMKTTVAYALSVCVVPFIPIDLAKILIVVAIGPVLRKGLNKAGLIQNTAN